MAEWKSNQNNIEIKRILNIKIKKSGEIIKSDHIILKIQLSTHKINGLFTSWLYFRWPHLREIHLRNDRKGRINFKQLIKTDRGIIWLKVSHNDCETIMVNIKGQGFSHQYKIDNLVKRKIFSCTPHVNFSQFYYVILIHTKLNLVFTALIRQR